MAHLNWKLAAAIAALILLALLAQRLTRRVPAYHPPPDRDPGAWSTVDSESAQRLQSILDEGVNALRVPGLQGFVRTADGQIWSGASGTADLARNTSLRREHVLRVGSTTKTFWAVVILKLVEQGALRLDDPLSKWFPDYPHADLITVRMLLNHSSGIPEFLQTPQVLMRSVLPRTSWKPEELIDIAAKIEPPFAPGGGWTYSNTNYVLLGLIGERITGRTAAELLRDMVIAPLGLPNTHFIPYEPPPAELVPGFDRDLSRFPGMLDIGPNDTSWATAAFTSGALASTAEDLGAFYHSLFARELLSRSTMKEMTSFIPASNPGFEDQDGYGLGLMRIKVDGRELTGHVGEFMGSTAIAMYAPDSNELAVVTSNLSYPDLVGPLMELLATLK